MKAEVLLLKNSFLFLFLCVVPSFFPIKYSRAEDWPQFLGSHRNGHATGEKIGEKFPQNGPRIVWQRKVGDGFAGIVVSAGKAVLFHRVNDKERVEVMDALTGKVFWTDEESTDYSSAFSPDKGPRATPLVHNGFVYLFGAQGRLQCFELKTGKRKWMRETHKDFRAQEGYFGAGSSPIVEDEKLIVNVGSRNGAGIVAFDLKTGKTLWKKTNEFASYSSPIAATVDGVRHLIFITRMKVISLDPKDGKIRFEFPFGQRGPTVNAASPVIVNGHLFVTAHYRVGAVWAKIEKDKSQILWRDDKTLSAHYATPIEHKGIFYGIHGQERVSKPLLRCFDPVTRKIYWQKEFYYGSMLNVEDKIIFTTTTGELILFQCNSRGYHELDRTRIFSKTTRAIPALSNGLLYVRDTNTLKCLDLRPRQ